MKIARFYSGKDIRIEDQPIPLPGENDVLVRVKSTGICGSDLHVYHVTEPFAKGPWTPGHEIAGIVEKVGTHVTDFAEGDRVSLEPTIPNPESPFFLIGRYEAADLTHIGSPAHPGGFAEYVVAPRTNTHPIADNVDFDHGSLAEVYAVAVHALTLFPVQLGDRIAVIGSGPVGLTIAELAQLAGAEKTILLGKPDAPLSIAESAIGVKTVNVDKSDSIEAVRELTEGRGADIVFEAVGGRADTIQQSLDIAAILGKVCVVGGHADPVSVRSGVARMKEITIGWSFCYGRRGFRKEFDIALDLMAAGKLQPDRWITHSFALDNIIKAFEAAAGRDEYGSIKVMVHP